MLRHSFKMIWAERKSNIWILIELTIVFSILWFCSGFVYDIGKKYFQPTGFDIKHTYLILFGNQKNIKIDSLSDEEKEEAGITIYERIKKYPGIESICFAEGNAHPYATSYSSNTYKKDSIDYSASTRNVNPDFFDVFKIKFQKGKSYDAKDIPSKKQIVISPDSKNKFFDEDVLKTTEIVKKALDPSLPRPKTEEEWENAKIIDVHYQITGITNKIKRGDYEDYQRIVFYPLEQKSLKNISGGVYISVRVKPDADKNFPEKFLKEMKEQLKVTPFELAEIQSFNDLRKEYLQMTGDQEKVETVFTVIIFLLINVFLGVLGTFRFRVNARRGEIGLRSAVGSSKSKIQQLFLGETFFLLLLASIPGTIIAINLQLTGSLSKLGISFLTLTEKTGFISRELGSEQSFLILCLITYAITFVTILVIIWLGTWYPAKKASEIQPAEALYYE